MTGLDGGLSSQREMRQEPMADNEKRDGDSMDALSLTRDEPRYNLRAMPWTTAAAAVGVALLTAGLGGQTAQLPKGQMPDLGRPTKVGDETPLFNFDEYFPGKWTFEWDVPEGVLGPSGRITGTMRS